MPLYEYRQGGRVRERVRPDAGGFEDTRLGVLAADREKRHEADGWHEVPDGRPAQVAADEQGQAPADEPKGSGKGGG